MRKLIKKTVALTAAFAMTLSMSAVAGAATNTTGDLKSDSLLEGYVNKTVYDITVPTIAKNGLDFTVDPQGLLDIADGDETNYTLGEGAVYFTNAGSPATYSNTSDAIELINNSSFDIDVSLDIEVTAADAGITLVEKDDLATAETPSLYLGLIVAGESAVSDSAIAITDDYKGTPETLSAVPEINGTSVTKGYTIKATQDKPEGSDAVASPNGNYYTYELAGGYDPAVDGKKVKFALEGQCDDASKADWSAVKTNVLSAKLVWSVTADELTSSESDPVDDYVMSLSDEDIVYTFATGLADDIEKVFIILPNGTSTERTGQLTAGNISYDSGSKKLTINPTAQTKCTITNAGTYKVKLTLADSSEITLTYVKK